MPAAVPTANKKRSAYGADHYRRQYRAMKKLLAIICLCLIIPLSGGLFIKPVNARPANTIAITRVYPKWPDGGWVPAQGGGLPQGAYLMGNTLTFEVRFSGFIPTGDTAVELLGSPLQSADVVLVGSSTAGNVTTRLYQIPGMIKRLGLSQNPSADITFALEVWEFTGRQKVSHSIAVRWKAYADWRHGNKG